MVGPEGWHCTPAIAAGASPASPAPSFFHVYSRFEAAKHIVLQPGLHIRRPADRLRCVDRVTRAALGLVRHSIRRATRGTGAHRDRQGINVFLGEGLVVVWAYGWRAGPLPALPRRWPRPPWPPDLHSTTNAHFSPLPPLPTPLSLLSPLPLAASACERPGSGGTPSQPPCRRRRMRCPAWSIEAPGLRKT